MRDRRKEEEEKPNEGGILSAPQYTLERTLY